MAVAAGRRVVIEFLGDSKSAAKAAKTVADDYDRLGGQLQQVGKEVASGFDTMSTKAGQSFTDMRDDLSKAESQFKTADLTLTPDVDPSRARDEVADVVSRAEAVIRAAAVTIRPTVDQDKARTGMADAVSKAESRARSANPKITPEVDGSEAESGMSDLLGSMKDKAKVGGAAAGAALAAALWDEMSAEASTDKVAAQLGLGPRQMARLGRIAGDLFADNWAGSVGEAAQGVGAILSSIPQMRFADEGAIARVSAKALAFADIFETDVARAAQIAGQMVRTGFADNADQAFDLLTAASQRVPAAIREDLLDAVDEYGPFFETLGLTGEEAFNLLVKGAERGQFGMDKTGDAVKELTIRATDMSTTTKDAFKAIGADADQMADMIASGGDRGRKAFDKIVDGLLGIEDPQKRANTAIALFGTPLEDLSVSDIPRFLRSLQDMDDNLGRVPGAMKRAMDTSADNMQSNLTSMANTARLGAQNIVAGFLAGDWDRVDEGMGQVWESVQNLYKKYWRQILTISTLGVGAVVVAIVDNWDKITGFFDRTWGKITGFFTGGWGKVRDTTSRAVGWVRDKITAGWDKVRDITDDLWGKIRSVVDNALDKVRDLVADTWAAIRDRVATILSAIRDRISDIFDAIRDRVSDIVDGTRDRIVDTWTSIRDRVGDAAGAMRDRLATIWDAIRDNIGNVTDGIRNIFDRLKDGVRAIPDAFRAARRGIGDIWEALKKTVGSPVYFVLKYVWNEGIAAALDKIPTVGDWSVDTSNIPHWRGGGYTGPGSKDKVAGLAHAREFVINADSTEKIERTNPGFLDALNKTGLPGHKAGGLVNPMARVYVDGEPLTAVHAAQLLIAGQLMGARQSVMQGSWQAASSYSGTSHTGPGVADTSPGSFRAQAAQRRAGIAAWARNIPGAAYAGSGAHIHGVSAFSAPGNSQLVSYYAGGDGLGGSDYGPRPGVLPGLYEKLRRFGDLTTIGSGLGMSMDIGQFPTAFTAGGSVYGAFDAIPEFKQALEDVWGDIHRMEDRGGWWPTVAKAPASSMDEVKDYGLGKIKDAGGWLRDKSADLIGDMSVRAHDAWEAAKGIDLTPGFSLASGGIVRARPGGTLALLGEGGRDEAVVPLPSGTHLAADQVVHVHLHLDGKEIQSSLVRLKRRNGGTPLGLN